MPVNSWLFPVDSCRFPSLSIESRRFPMVPGQFPLIPVDSRRFPSIPVDSRRFPSIPLDSRRFLSIPVDFRRIQSISIDFRRFPSIPVDSRRFPSIPVDSRQISSISDGSWSIPVNFSVSQSISVEPNWFLSIPLVRYHFEYPRLIFKKGKYTKGCNSFLFIFFRLTFFNKTLIGNLLCEYPSMNWSSEQKLGIAFALCLDCRDAEQDCKDWNDCTLLCAFIRGEWI